MTIGTMLNRKKITRIGQLAYLFAARGPAYHYAYGRWRALTWLQRAAGRSFAVDDAALARGLNLKSADLATHFQTRVEPKFFFDASDRGAIEALIRDEDKAATIRIADEVCHNVFNFRGAGPIAFTTGIDWMHRPQGNIDWMWDLNRHAYFETLGRAYWYTGDERYARKFRHLLLDWLACNPADIDQPNWGSVFEVAFRICAWVWAFHYFRSSPAFDDEVCRAFLKGLLAHGRYLAFNIELHVPNNHLLLEARALVVLGILFPEFKEAARWRRRGLEILYREVRAQVCPDGVHGERSSHYHRVIAGDLLELLVLMANNDLPLDRDLVAAFSRMVEFELWLTKPDGSIPLLGDATLADTHLRFSAASDGPIFLNRTDLANVAPPPGESSVWLLGPKRIASRPASTPKASLTSRAFPHGGYFVMRAESSYLIFDCGPFGYKPMPNHGHADALSFDLYAGGRTLLVDPGVYSTSLGSDWRNFFRGTRAHNTLTVDGLDQSTLIDTRRVYRPAVSTLYRWIAGDQFDFVDGSHNGYTRLPDPIVHRRQIFFVKPEYWIVIDVLTGRGRHRFDAYFHLMPDAASGLDAGSKALWANGIGIIPLDSSELQAEIVAGSTDPIQGWVSFYSGEKQAAPVLRYTREGGVPLEFCTVLYPNVAGENRSVAVTALPVSVDGRSADAARLTGLRIEVGAHVDYLVIDRGLAGTNKSFAGYETDAQIVYARHERDGLRQIKTVACDGSRLTFEGQSLPLVEGTTENLARVELESRQPA